MEHDHTTHSDNPLGQPCAMNSGSVAVGDPATSSCPFGCRIPHHLEGESWYRHVSHHMEDIRLLALPPSLRPPPNGFEGDRSAASADSGDLAALDPVSLAPIMEEFSTGPNVIIDNIDTIEHSRSYISETDDHVKPQRSPSLTFDENLSTKSSFEMFTTGEYQITPLEVGDLANFGVEYDSRSQQQNVGKQIEKFHSCEKCNKQFPRACDLKWVLKCSKPFGIIKC